MKFWKILGKIFVYAFAVIGFVLTAGFFAVKYDWTNTIAVVDKNSDKYQAASMQFNQSDVYNAQAQALTDSDNNLNLKSLETKISELNNTSQTLATLKLERLQDLCKVEVVGQNSPINAKNIMEVYHSGGSQWTLSQMFLAVSLRLETDANFQKSLSACETVTTGDYDEDALYNKYETATGPNIFGWANLESWDIVTQAILKDAPVIKKAASAVDINPRLLVSVLIVEQLRLYNTQREFYEKFFKPLQILASANKMAWGVMAIKEKTAIDIENNLKSSNSGFYLGEGYTHLLDFKTANPTTERYNRLADEHDHYYSYLYGSLLIKELINQWEGQGYEVKNRPEVLATLFNIGFMKSKPKANPQVGGSIINLNNVDYTFGSLAHEFYYSNLLPEFPLD